MGNTSTAISRRNSTSTGNNVKRVQWGSSGLPGPPGKPILIPSFTEDSQPIIVGIRWERSSYNGGSAIIGYLVEHRRLGSPHWVRSSPGLCSFPELTLRGLEPGWRYQFRVRAQNTIGLSPTSEISDPLTVTLQRAEAAAPHFISELRDTTALENEQVEFVVHFAGTPIPKISWFKDGFEIFSSRRTKIITENGRSSLVIHQTALNDEGEIKCTAVNKAGHTSTRGKLILQALPKIRLPRQYEDGLLFEKGETIKLKISIAGRPSPCVKWYHDGEMIILGDRHIIESIDTGEYSLTILTAVRNDRGEYTITASNELGEDSSSFLVTVTDRPSAPGTIRIIMTLGRSVTLSWDEPEDDGGCKIGTYIVEYYRVGWNVWLKANTSRRPEATLVDLIGDSEYRFRVKAENPYGISDPSKESDVVFIPHAAGSSSKSAPTLPRDHKLQSEQQNSRGRRLDKYEDDIKKSTKRTRSLTRAEATASHEHSEDFYRQQSQALPSRSVSVQRLSSDAPLTKSFRSDSRVTFADTVFLHADEPLDDTFVPRAKPRVKRDKNLKVNDRKANDLTQTPATDLNDQSNSSEKNLLSNANITSDSIPQNNNVNSPIEKGDDEEKNDEEFMLILYPNTDIGNVEDKYAAKIETNFESDDDLIPPPMSRSLPELFSVDHHIVETVREAFSSTELLHERALERFQKAVAMEEANSRKNISNSEKWTDGKDLSSNKLRNPVKIQSGSGLAFSDAQAMWNKRRLSEGQTVCEDMGSVFTAPPMAVASDSNLDNLNLNEESINDLRQSFPELITSLRRWDDSNLYSGSENKLLIFDETSASNLENLESNFTQDEALADNEELLFPSDSAFTNLENVESDEDASPVESGEFGVTSQDNIYYASGIETVLQTSRKNSIPGANVAQPKSILKKRVDDAPANRNNFSQPLETFGETKSAVSQELNDGTMRDDGHTKLFSGNGNGNAIIGGTHATDLPVMSDTESDNTSLMIAAEVAQNRRKSSAKSLMAKKESAEVKEDIEAQRAVIDHYTEIVNAHSVSPSHYSSNYPTGRSSRVTSPSRMSSGESPKNPDNFNDNSQNATHKIPNAPVSSNNQSTKNFTSQRKPAEQIRPSESTTNSLRRNSISSRSSRIDLGRSSRESSTSRSSSKTRKRRGKKMEKKIDEISGVNPNFIDRLEKLQGPTEVLEKASSRASKIINRNKQWSDETGRQDGDASGEPLILQTQIKVQSIMSYVIDLILFLGAVYIYLFKKEILAIPLIGLVLYRRIQADITNWIPHKHK
uniref:TTN_1 protein n=1 Tax=Fopius arisanus TaxID=64838 RepID=A0A0C9QAL6_9HYME